LVFQFTNPKIVKSIVFIKTIIYKKTNPKIGLMEIEKLTREGESISTVHLKSKILK